MRWKAQSVVRLYYDAKEDPYELLGEQGKVATDKEIVRASITADAATPADFA